MPDREEFKKYVKEGWRSAAMLALLHEGHPDAPRKALLALQRDLKSKPGEEHRGLPGFVEIIDLLQRSLPTMSGPMAESEHGAIDGHLEEIRRGGHCSITEEAVNAARQMPRDPGYVGLLMSREAIGALILAHVARSRLSPGLLLQELSHKRGLSIPQCLARLRAVVDEIKTSPDVLRLAAQLLDDPSGILVTESRRATRPSQTEILTMSLTP